MITFLLLLAGLSSFHCAAIKNTFSSLQEMFDNSNCSIPPSILETKFGSGVENSHLKAFLVPLEECTRISDIPQLTEEYRLCKEVSRALYNISTCNKNNLDKILNGKTNFSIESSADALCSAFHKLDIMNLNDSECLSCGFQNKMVCEIICKKNLKVCDILLWAYEIQNALIEVNLDTNSSGNLTEVTKITVGKPSTLNLDTSPQVKHMKSKNKEIIGSSSITSFNSPSDGIVNKLEFVTKQIPSSSDSDNLLNQNNNGDYSEIHVNNNNLAESGKAENGAGTNIEKNHAVRTKDSPPSSTKNMESPNPVSQSKGSNDSKYVQTSTSRSKPPDEDTKNEQQEKHDAANHEAEPDHSLIQDKPKDKTGHPVLQNKPQNVGSTEKYDGEDHVDTYTKQKVTEQKVSDLNTKKVIPIVVTSNPKVKTNKEVTTNLVNKSPVVPVATEPSVQSKSPEPSQRFSVDGDQFVNVASHDELLPSEGDEPADTSNFMDQKGISENIKPGSDEYDLPLDDDSETQKDKVERLASKFSEGTVRSGKEFSEQEDAHFFFYFLSIVMIVMVCYLVFHNKQKIIALIVEGCHERRRRPHGVNYRKLESK